MTPVASTSFNLPMQVNHDWCIWDSTKNGFNAPHPVKNPTLQNTYVARNTATGAIYVVHYSPNSSVFTIDTTISGSAPTNGQQVMIAYEI